MRFFYKQLDEYFAEPLPNVEDLAEVLTRHSSEVEEIIPHGEGDWELEVKILPDRAGDAKTPAGLAREINSLFPNLKPKIPWTVPDENTARVKIRFTLGQINGLLGVNLTQEQIIVFLNRVGVVVVDENQDELIALVPKERLDLNIKEDLADEVARLYGYDQIPARILTTEILVKREPTFDLANKVRAQMATEGCDEIYGYTFVAHGELEVEKPLASDKAFLRDNLSEGMKKMVEYNLSRVLFDTDKIKLFEIGNVFVGGVEEMRVATGFGCKKPKLTIEVTEKKLAEFETKDLAGEISDFINRNIHYKPVSVYPRIIRDIAVWVPESIEVETVAEIIKNSAGELCVGGPVLFDEFSKEGRKSLAFRLVFQSYAKTLSDEETTAPITSVVTNLEKQGFEVRK
jgi:phenylalanyl-tRNA synthetase beta subunit